MSYPSVRQVRQDCVALVQLAAHFSWAYRTAHNMRAQSGALKDEVKVKGRTRWSDPTGSAAVQSSAALQAAARQLAAALKAMRTGLDACSRAIPDQDSTEEYDTVVDPRELVGPAALKQLNEQQERHRRHKKFDPDSAEVV